jgi:hypothetical protein
MMMKVYSPDPYAKTKKQSDRKDDFIMRLNVPLLLLYKCLLMGCNRKDQFYEF